MSLLRSLNNITFCYIIVDEYNIISRRLHDPCSYYITRNFFLSTSISVSVFLFSPINFHKILSQHLNHHSRVIYPEPSQLISLIFLRSRCVAIPIHTLPLNILISSFILLFHKSILAFLFISVTLILCSVFLFITQHSELYRIAGLFTIYRFIKFIFQLYWHSLVTYNI